MGEILKIDGSELSIFKSGASREKILAFQSALESHPNKLSEPVPVQHYFAPGLYVREMVIPAGTCIVGKIHKHAHFNDISKGRILVTTEFGSEEFVGPHRFVSEPGTKRCVLALEETVWTTFHPTSLTDLEAIEDEVIAKTYEEFDGMNNLIEVTK